MIKPTDILDDPQIEAEVKAVEESLDKYLLTRKDELYRGKISISPKTLGNNDIVRDKIVEKYSAYWNIKYFYDQREGSWYEFSPKTKDIFINR